MFILSSTPQTRSIYARIGIFHRLWFLFLILQFSLSVHLRFLHWVLVYKITACRVYHQFWRNCISPKQRFAYHHCKSYATCGWWYTPLAMIYTLKCDDIPLLSQWIKKDSPQTVFFGAGNVTRTRDLLITNELLYQLSYSSRYLILIRLW